MVQKTEARKQIELLAARFTENISQYKRTDYDEANTRVDFIDPFFEALGWDVANKEGYAEQYREVVREAKVIIVGKHKAPDYSFRIGGIRKFFVEAKKPSVDLKKEVSPAFQLRRYAYTAKLPLSILTDFEEISVYDTRIKPSVKDLASVARIFYCSYKDYLKNLDFLYDTFSKDAILKGSFDRYIESTKKKRGTSEVDKEFLKLIDQWREKLAKNIAIRNKKLTLYELNFAVQKIIDRIIFLRIAEDRQIEDYGKLQVLSNGANVYERLRQIFYHSDKRYNSGLFDFKKDRITPSLIIDDKVIKEIIKSVYYPDSPYEFSVLGVEILGNIYEQFLGKTIRLTPAHQVKVEEKPEVKKAGGVYYTPKYIVDYIVKNTVGEIIKKKTPKQIEKIKILDPACGSGSFLLGAYQSLLDEHLNWYSKEGHNKKALKQGKIIQIGKNSYQLSVAEKQRILTNNIFGVDIDRQAVEVSKLSLLLKLLEGETEESTGRLFRYTQLKLLPDLSNNIKCGNSLIGTDYFEGRITGTIDEDELRKINPFDWQKEFTDVFAQGGFDAVIGNPPYVNIENIEKNVREFLLSSYSTCEKRTDIYIPFMEKGLSLINSSGLLSFIIPFAFTNQIYGEALRKKIIKEHSLQEILDLSSYFVFQEANVKNIIIRIRKTFASKKSRIATVNNKNEFFRNIKFHHIYQKELLNLKNSRFETKDISKLLSIKKKLFAISILFEQICYIAYGARLNHRSKKIGKKAYIFEEFRDGLKPYIEGRDIERYYFTQDKFLDYKPKEHYNAMFPELFENDKIMFINVVKDKLRFCYDNSGIYNSHTVINCVPFNNLIDVDYSPLKKYRNTMDVGKVKNYSIKYLLGLLNSTLMGWYFKFFLSEGVHCYPNDAKQLPIRKIDFSNPKEKKMHDDLVAMVDKMLKSQKKYHSARLEQDKKLYKTQIDLLDHQIDSLVYKLYGLTEDEIKVVEGSLKEG